ncbi:MAG: hypothetical protein ACE145_05765 [Terriglobia bacterium]
MIVSFSALADGGIDTVERFKQLYGNVRDYTSIQLLTLNGQKYILAFWNEDNDPLQLWVNIFAYSDDQLHLPVYKAYSGDVSEQLIEVAQCKLTDPRTDDLVFLSKAGHIEMIRVLHQKGRELQLVFENGGADVTLPTGQGEVWIKNRTGKELTVYRWDRGSNRFVERKSLPIAF